MQSSGNSSEGNGSAISDGTTRPRDRFSLRARSVHVDERLNAVRRDLADAALADRVFAPHYAVPARRSIARSGPLLSEPGGAERSVVLTGEQFDVLELTRSHGWGRSLVDGAVGYVSADLLVTPFAVTHIVSARSTQLYARAEAGSDVLATLPMGSRLSASAARDGWLETDGGYVPVDTLAPVDRPHADIATLAEGLLGTPERSGGRSGEGVDAAGLLFLCAGIAGHPVPRFADLQAAEIGIAVAAGDTPSRGDIQFRGQHVAILTDGSVVIHVDGEVRREPIAELERFGPVTARRRLA